MKSFDSIRSGLADRRGRAYWRSLEELADTPEFREYVAREFPAQASEFTDPAGRRQFLKLMGASLALAGVSACTRQPEEKIIPYVRQPDEVVPGRPLFFATAMPLGGFAMPLLAENHMGRPTKLEGNPEHPASLGATDIFSQASVLSLYDPDRSRTVINRGEVRSWSAFIAALQSAVQSRQAAGGEGLRLLTEPVTSPSLVEQIEKLLESMPSAKWHQWDPVYGAVQGGAPAERPVYRFDRADIVVSLDADFLGYGPGSLRYQKDFSSRRRIRTPEEQQNRLYAAEPAPTVTGTKAEHRLAARASEIHGLAAALASAVGAPGGGASSSLSSAANAWVAAAAADLQSHRGRAVVVAGERQPAAVHALARSMNQALGGVGATVTYSAPVTASPADGAASIAELAADMNTGRVSLLLILGGNPVFNAPVDTAFTAALRKMDEVGTIFHLGLYHDETAELCHWHVPEAHYLESWGDARSFDGTVTLIQPLIAPLYGGRQAIEVLAAMNGTVGTSPADLLKDYWSRAFQKQTRTAWTLTDPQGNAFGSVETFWRHALHDGFVSGTPGTPGTGGAAAASAPSSAPSSAPPSAPPSAPSFEVIFRPDPTILDGRYANNGWLQELPKPISKVTWDSVAYVGVRTAERLGIALTGAADPNSAGNTDKEIVEITIQNRSVRLPVWILPGTADDVIVVHFGYGRRKAGRVGTDVGHDAFPLRTAAAPWFEGGATVSKTGDTYAIAATQNHFMMEGRNPVRVVEAAEYPYRAQGVDRQAGPRAGAEDVLALSALFVQRLQMGHVHRPQRLHGVQRLRRCLCRREQHRRRRQVRGDEDARDALDPRRHVFLGQPRRAGGVQPARPVPAVRERAVRGGLPRRGDAAQRRRPERHDLQPLRGDAVLLEQLPLQGAAVQLPPVLGFLDAGAVRGAQPGRHDPEPRRDGEVHLLRAADRPRADRRQGRRPADSGRRGQDGVPAGVPERGDRLRRSERSREPRRAARRTGAELRIARGSEHPAAHDLPGGRAERQRGGAEAGIGLEFRLESSCRRPNTPQAM